jgi:hypothetical protein
MPQFSPMRKAFLFAALIFVLDNIGATVIAMQMNLSDLAIGGAARDHWFTAGTPLTAPGVFMIPYVILLALATRKLWMGVIGIAGVSLLTLLSGISWIADLNTGLLPRLIENPPERLHRTLPGGSGFNDADDYRAGHRGTRSARAYPR